MLVALGFQETILDATTAKSMVDVNEGAPIPAGTQFVMMKTETQNVRWRDDGNSPDATHGMLMQTTDPAFLYGGNVYNLKVIATTAGAKLSVTFYKQA